MRKKTINRVLNAESTMKNIISNVNWINVVVFIMSIILIVNIGFYVNYQLNPTKALSMNIEKMENPFQNELVKFDGVNSFLGADTTNTQNGATSETDIVEIWKEKTEAKNIFPIAKIRLMTSDVNEGLRAGDTIFLDASNSYDPDGRVSEYRWDYDSSNGLGIDEKGMTATPKYNNPGVYTVTLVVIDDKDDETTTSFSLNILPKKEKEYNPILNAYITADIDTDLLNMTARALLESSISSSVAEFKLDATSQIAQAIENAKNVKLPKLPNLSDLPLEVRREADKNPPDIKVTTPENGAKIFQRRPIISVGYYDENGIDLDSVMFSFDGNDITGFSDISPLGLKFTPNTDLSYGYHSATIKLKDKVGRESVYGWNFIVIDPNGSNDIPEYIDDKGPQILNKVPADNSKNVGVDKPLIRVTYDEPVVRDSFTLTIMDLKTNIVKMFTGSDVVWSMSDRSFEVSNEELYNFNSSYKIILDQKDELGNPSRNEWYINTEDYGAPTFSIYSPANGVRRSETDIEIKGYTDPTNKIYLNEYSALVTSSGSWSGTYPLERGENSIKVKAIDLRGRSSESLLTITYDPYAGTSNPVIDNGIGPVIMDSSIQDGGYVTEEKPTIKFVYSAIKGINRDKIQILIDGEDLTPKSLITSDKIVYKPIEPIKDGIHAINLILTDKENNTLNYDMTFTMDSHPDTPSNLTASLVDNNKSVLLLWDGVTGFDLSEYRVYRSTIRNFKPSASNEVKRTIDTSWTDNNPVNNVNYYYKVVAVGQKEQMSDASNEVEILVDGTAPKLHISSHSDGETVSTENIVIKGITEKDSFVQVLLNGDIGIPPRNPSVDSIGQFEQNLLLNEGSNIITIITTDITGNEYSKDLIITYKVPDTEVPDVENKSPINTDVNISENIVIEYKEPINDKTFELKIKETGSPDVSLPVTIADVRLNVSKDKKTFTYNPKDDFKYGTSYTVTVNAYDLEGNESINDDWTFITISDKIAPSLIISYPQEGFTTKDSYLNVSGVTDSDAKVSIYVNGILELNDTQVSVIDNGSFSERIALQPTSDNKNIITILSSDEEGNTSQVVRNIVYNDPDLIKPILTISSPLDGTITGNANIVIQGQSEKDSSVVVNVNGVSQGDATILSNGVFMQNVTLNKGNNLITVVNVDKSNNRTVEKISITYDDVAPSLMITNPINNFYTQNGGLNIYGKTDTDNSIISITLNGTVSKTNLRPNIDGSFEHSLVLSSGENQIIVTATDENSNSISIQRTVTYDPTGSYLGTVSSSGTSSTLPALSNDSVSPPSSSSSTENEVSSAQSTESNSILGGLSSIANTLSGIFTGSSSPVNNDFVNFTGGDNESPDLIVDNDDELTTNPTSIISGTTEQEALVTIVQNGEVIAKGLSDLKDGDFSASASLDEGKNVILTKVQDASGNTVLDLTKITLDTEAPVAFIQSPTKGLVTKETSITVSGTAEADATVRVNVGGSSNVNAVVLPNGYFQAEVSLGFSSGSKTINVVVTDNAGNIATYPVEITLDILSPGFSYETLGSLNISGQFRSSLSSTMTIYTNEDAPLLKGFATEENTKLTLFVNNQKRGNISVNPDNTFGVVLPLTKGMNEVKVVGVDEAGNENIQYSKIFFDKTPPVVTLVNPIAGVENGAFVPVKLRIDDNSGRRVDYEVYFEDLFNPIYASVNNSVPETLTYNLDTDLFINPSTGLKEEGNKVVKFIVTDSQGNKTEKNLSFVWESGNPVVNIEPGYTFVQSDISQVNDTLAEWESVNDGIEDVYEGASKPSNPATPVLPVPPTDASGKVIWLDPVDLGMKEPSKELLLSIEQRYFPGENFSGRLTRIGDIESQDPYDKEVIQTISGVVTFRTSYPASSPLDTSNIDTIDAWVQEITPSTPPDTPMSKTVAERTPYFDTTDGTYAIEDIVFSTMSVDAGGQTEIIFLFNSDKTQLALTEFKLTPDIVDSFATDDSRYSNVQSRDEGGFWVLDMAYNFTIRASIID